MAQMVLIYKFYFIYSTIAFLHIGHVFFDSSHCITQFLWNKWEQGKHKVVSSTTKSSLQMGQDGCEQIWSKLNGISLNFLFIIVVKGFIFFSCWSLCACSICKLSSSSLNCASSSLNIIAAFASLLLINYSFNSN